MASESTDAEWLREAGGLTVEPAEAWPTDQLFGGEVLVVRLVALARCLPIPAATATTPRGNRAPDSCCEGARCPLTGSPVAGEACRLAADLARCAPPVGLSVARGPDVAERYLAALRDAAGAVYFCRRVQHAGGRCWFSVHGPEEDLCGRVLAVAHRLSPRDG